MWQKARIKPRIFTLQILCVIHQSPLFLYMVYDEFSNLILLYHILRDILSDWSRTKPNYLQKLYDPALSRGQPHLVLYVFVLMANICTSCFQMQQPSSQSDKLAGLDKGDVELTFNTAWNSSSWCQEELRKKCFRTFSRNPALCTPPECKENLEGFL